MQFVLKISYEKIRALKMLNISQQDVKTASKKLFLISNHENLPLLGET